MAVTIKPSELLKRIAYRYYPIYIIMSLPSLYFSRTLYYPEVTLSRLWIVVAISTIYSWLIIILGLKIIKPVGFINRLSVIILSYLIGILIHQTAVFLFFNPVGSIFTGSPLSFRLLIGSLTTGFYIVGSVILAERSLIFEETYIEEKTERLLSEKQLMENHLNLLQARMEPEFLFAIMDRISDLFDTAPEKAKTIQMYFIQYLRSTLARTRESVTTIKQEMELISSYLDIIKTGMCECLEYHVKVDPLAEDLPIPSMLIQPVVENAINNTLDMDSKGGLISLSVDKPGDIIRITATNTGKGSKEMEKAGNIIDDVKERMTGLFGDRGKLRLEENMPDGLTVIIEVPCG
jgi:sensor histidine kinase YesM